MIIQKIKSEIIRNKALKIIFRALFFVLLASLINQYYFFPMIFAWLCHELGHMLAAIILKSKLQIDTSRGPLLGVSHEVAGGYKEALIAAAGPIINILIAYFFYLHNYHYIYQANLMLAFCNLLPVLPLDGGKIIRGLFSYFFGWLGLTYFLIGFGQILALVFAMLILWLKLHFSLLLLPVTIYILCYLEMKTAKIILYKSLIKDTESLWKIKRLVRVSGDLPIFQVINYFSPGYDNLVFVKGCRCVIPEKKVLNAWLNQDGVKQIKTLI